MFPFQLTNIGNFPLTFISLYPDTTIENLAPGATSPVFSTNSSHLQLIINIPQTGGAEKYLLCKPESYLVYKGSTTWQVTIPFKESEVSHQTPTHVEAGVKE
jgi:hypothetical protein